MTSSLSERSVSSEVSGIAYLLEGFGFQDSSVGFRIRF